MEKFIQALYFIVLVLVSNFTYGQNENGKPFSLGTYGRIGVGLSPNGNGNTGRKLNLNYQGALGGRLEQSDYIELMPNFYFKPKIAGNPTKIEMHARLAFYSGSSFLGAGDTNNDHGMIIALPEAYVEARDIMGSHWNIWVGARNNRFDDINIVDYFYFDDHSSSGWGVKRKNTSFSMYFPAAIDTTARNMTPYSYTNIISGIKNLEFRQREVFVLEQEIPIKQNNKIKLLAEFHNLSKSGDSALKKLPKDNGWVLGAKLSTKINTPIPGSFNQFSIRYGSGIANGGGAGNTQTWRTFGAPDRVDKTYSGAYSFTMVEHFLWNISSRWSINPYFVYTRSKGGDVSDNKALDFYDKSIFNKKDEFNIGARATYYYNNWFHIVSELHYATRKDGVQNPATMWKFALAPTIVPTSERSAFATPHIRLIAEVARYNDQAMNTLYSEFLQHAGRKRFGTFFGIRTEWSL